MAITMVIHGAGMYFVLRVNDELKERFHPRHESFMGGLALIILASLMIVIINLIEVIVWALFFLWNEAQPSHSVSFYNALLNYTTLGAGYLPKRWHLLEPLLAMAGLLTVAWSTGILFMLAQDFQNTQLAKRRRQRAERLKANRGPLRDAPSRPEGD